jgi:hypothetical protein
MQTDRELLELAAKAAGLEINWRCQRERDEAGSGDVGLWLTTDHTCWNPLTDGDDALRPAVKLHLTIMLGPMSCKVVQVSAEDDDGADCTAHAFERLCADPYAATRRAIVRAAAALGGAA